MKALRRPFKKYLTGTFPHDALCTDKTSGSISLLLSLLYPHGGTEAFVCSSNHLSGSRSATKKMEDADLNSLGTQVLSDC